MYSLTLWPLVASLVTAFHYSSQLQTWSKTWSQTCVQRVGNRWQACRKHVESQLRTCLKRVFFLHYISLARARTNEPAANLLHQSRRRDGCSRFATKFSTKKVESVSQTSANLSRTWSRVCSWLY